MPGRSTQSIFAVVPTASERGTRRNVMCGSEPGLQVSSVLIASAASTERNFSDSETQQSEGQRRSRLLTRWHDRATHIRLALHEASLE